MFLCITRTLPYYSVLGIYVPEFALTIERLLELFVCKTKATRESVLKRPKNEEKPFSINLL